MINRELIRLKVVQLVYAYYQNDGRTLETVEKELDYSLDKAYDLYLYMLSFLVELRQYAERKDAVRLAREERTGQSVGGVVPDKAFADNKLLRMLEANETLIDFREKKKGNWPDEAAVVRKVYNKMTSNEVFDLYLQLEDFSFAADREVVRKLYKTCICYNDDFDALLEDHSLYWNDDKEVVDSFVLKTIKRFTETTKPDAPLLPPYDDDQDLVFAHTLFRSAIIRGDELRDMIRRGTKNWEFDRLTFMDVIIMQIALAEILTFDDIPLAVSFNEYLDIAKVYSTEKSPSYINGMLDAIVTKLREEGITTKQRLRPRRQTEDAQTTDGERQNAPRRFVRKTPGDNPRTPRTRFRKIGGDRSERGAQPE